MHNLKVDGLQQLKVLLLSAKKQNLRIQLAQDHLVQKSICPTINTKQNTCKLILVPLESEVG